MKIYWGILAAAALELTILANLVILDIAVFKKPKATSSQISTSAPQDCGEACMKYIQDSVEQAISALPQPTPVTIQKTTTIRTSGSSVKEFFIPLGSGSTENDQWEDITGAEAYIDTGSYSQIQTAYFEVSMRIPTKNGTVYARLYNVTDKHPVWFSEVSTESDISKFVATQIKLDPGNKQYRVQMKTTLRYTSLLDFARVKIITK